MADAKVIRLPTAARRRVRQLPVGERRELAAQLDQHPAEFLLPFVREMNRKREAARGSAAESMKDDAGLLIACSLLMLADRDLRSKVAGLVFGFHDLFRTEETARALALVDRALVGDAPPKGAA